MTARENRAKYQLLTLLAAVAVLALAAGCSETVTTSGSTKISDAGADLQVVDLPKPATTDQAQWQCPGGHGCACEVAEDCPFSGLCLADTAGALACAAPCPQGFCAPGERCVAVAEATAAGPWCVLRAAHICDPCLNSADCQTPGHPAAACVRYGAEGGFCGVSCKGDADCDTGYQCSQVPTAEGNAASQCVRSGAAPGQLGLCECSARAMAEKLSTTCSKGLCEGERSCGEEGLSACSAKAPGAEACNGEDDDCDGLTDEGSCDDNNPCTIDTCAGASGCQQTPAEGAPCNADSNLCTQGDSCKGSTCTAGPALVCDDGNPCTTESCSPVSGCQIALADGKACDDGDGCTTSDVCKSGKCVGGSKKACDDQNPCTADSCSGGACQAVAVDGAPCSDDDACTGADACAAGNCTGKALNCDDKNPCTSDACDPALGCQGLPVPATPCDDGNLCTTGEKCQSGKCQGGTVTPCTDDSGCLVVACQPATGDCGSKLKPDGTTCSDGKACTTGDACAKGACVAVLSCDDKDACTADVCGANGSCVHLPLTTEACAPSACVGVDCDDKNACTVDGCDATGCTHVGATGSACDDLDACTGGDACTSGGGCAGTAVTCKDDNACTDDSCDKGVGCTFFLSTAPCDLGGCQAGLCDKGTCLPTGATGCDDANPCTNDVCGTGGCTYEKLGDGTTCDDAVACTTDDACTAGLCAGKAKVCADGGPCATNSCDEASGDCSAKPETNNTPCNDGNACTSGEACQAGLCQGATVTCDDSDVCTDDSCDPTTGCKHVAATDGGSCSDGSVCTTGDLCKGGKCAGTAIICDDKNPCTSDGCDLAAGCTVTDVADTTSCDDGDPCTLGDACTSGKCAGAIPDDIVSTFAGAGEQGFANGTGAQAKFTLPTALAVGPDGALYVADAAAGGARIRKVDANGAVATLAGIGVDGFADGPAALAKFWNPAGLAVDASSTVYVADRFNQRIRKITSTGVVSTLAGNAPEAGFLDTKAQGGFADGNGTTAQFDEPAAIALGPDGKLYVADAANHKIRVVETDGTVTTLAGSTQGYSDAAAETAKFDTPQGIAVATDGTVYVSDTGNNRIRTVKAGQVVTWAGTGLFGLVDGPLLDACMAAPTGLFFGGDGNLYLADTGNNALRIFDTDKVSTLAGSGVGGFAEGAPKQAQFKAAMGIVRAGAGLWYVADTQNFRIRKIYSATLACQP